MGSQSQRAVRAWREPCPAIADDAAGRASGVEHDVWVRGVGNQVALRPRVLCLDEYPVLTLTGQELHARIERRRLIHAEPWGSIHGMHDRIVKTCLLYTSDAADE